MTERDPSQHILGAMARTEQERLSRAYSNAQSGSDKLFEAISAFEQVLHGASHALDALPNTVPAEKVLIAWRGSHALLHETLDMIRTSASTFSDAVGVIVIA